MQLFLMTLLYVITSLCYAEDKKDLSNYQTLDMKQFDQLKSNNDSVKISFSVTCKTEDGREIKSTDSEYQTCLIQSQNKIKNQGK